MVLEFKNLFKTYSQGSQDIPVLQGVNLLVEKPGTLALIGASGSGKSTLLSLAAGLDHPDRGEIWWDNERIDRLPFEELSKLRTRKIGIIFQQFHLLPHLTALENAELPLRFQLHPQSEKIAQETLGRVGLGHRLEHYPHQLSRGECQRVALARVLVTSPKIIFADEPTGSLDPKNAEDVLKQLFTLCEESQALLFLVTHDIELARHCEQVYRLDQGTLHHLGSKP